MSSFEITKKFTEETDIIWKIPDFTKLQEAKTAEDDVEYIEFPAGQTLDQPSTWVMELCFNTGNEIGLYFFLDESPKSVYATFTATANYRNKDIKMADNSSIKEVQVGDGVGLDNFLVLETLKAVEILDNAPDTLIIHAKVVIYAKKTHTPEEMLKEKALNRMTKHFPELLKSGQYSDFVIKVKDVDSGEYIEKKVHRNILSTQSPVFEAMFESPMLEKESGVVTIEDLSPTGLDVLLEFMYSGNISDAWKSVPEEVLNAAEKYNLPLLKDYIGKRLHEVVTEENAVILFNFAQEHDLPDVAILEYIKSNLRNVLKKM